MAAGAGSNGDGHRDRHGAVGLENGVRRDRLHPAIRELAAFILAAIAAAITVHAGAAHARGPRGWVGAASSRLGTWPAKSPPPFSSNSAPRSACASGRPRPTTLRR